MNGRFDIKLLNSCGLKDEDFLEARRRGELIQLMNSLNVDGKFGGENRVFEGMAAFLLQQCFSTGVSRAVWNYIGAGDNYASLDFMILLSTDSDTDDYQEYVWDFWAGTINGGVTDTVNTNNDGTGAAKRFIEDQMFDYSINVLSNRDEISFKNAWMYLPTQGIANNIKSIGIIGCPGGTGGMSRNFQCCPYERVARIRIKDSDGNPTTIVKTENQVLFVEYEFRLLSA